MSRRRRRSRLTSKKFETATNDMFYAFAMTNPSGDWRYPHFADRGSDVIYVSSVMSQRFRGVHDEMLDLWKRIAVDQALEFDDNIDPTSLRLLRVKVSVEDVTEEMFREHSEFAHHQKLTVLGRLTDSEAKMLGLTKERAIYKLWANPDSHPDDRKLLRRLGDVADEIEGGSILDIVRD
jgi:hypothetical protein